MFLLNALHTLFAFAGAIVLLVGLHELGHLVAARLCGIKVLRFSIGIGKPFFSKTWRNIEWSFSPLPLGGYVKMSDTREGNVPEQDLPHAFDLQHPIKRIIVVAAGPLTNLVLAVLLYAFSFGVGGMTEIRPYVGTVQPASIAAAAGFREGDRIISVNGETVGDFNDALLKMVLDLETGTVSVQVQTADGQRADRIINAAGTDQAQAVAKRQASLGISPNKLSDTIGYVLPDGAAAKAGLQAGDRIVAVNGQATPQWEQWSQIVRENAGRSLKISYIRQGKTYQTSMIPASEETPDRNRIIGRAGVQSQQDSAWAAKVRHHYIPSPWQAVQAGWQKTAGYSEMTLSFFGKLVTGNASLSHISGPLTIAEVAGHTAKAGWQSYVEFLALVSISLGIMNLLPIPVLDGGHLVYYTAELIRGKPLSKTVQDIGLRLGVAVILTMMILAFFNDITRLFG